MFFGFMFLYSLCSVRANASGLRVGPFQWPAHSCDDLLQSALQIVPILAPRERTDRNVISVRISERELLRSSVRIEVWLFFEPTDERACPLECQVEIIDTEEQ